MLILAGIWYFWDGVPSGRQDSIREKKDTHPSSPVFSASGEEGRPGGTLVVSSAPAVRRRPLPDLFAPGLAEKKENVPAEKKKDAAVAAGDFIELKGVIGREKAYLVLLSYQEATKVCAAGDRIGPYVVVYVGETYACLQRDGVYTEVFLTAPELPK